MSKLIYMDWAATALHDEDLFGKALERALELPGNPSAQHDAGYAARNELDECRSRCARVLGCEEDHIYFTSGGTESNNLVLLSRLLDRNPGRLLITALEHAAIGEPAGILGKSGAHVKILKPGGNGRIAPETLARQLTRDTRTVAVIAVHNETGVIQNLSELVRTVRDYERNEGGRPIHFHTDMVQAPGKMAIDLKALDIDSASFSAHKIRGPKGAGLLYLRKKTAVLYRGGGQEGGLRPGTESVFNALAMAMSLEKWGAAPPSEESLLVYDLMLDKLAAIDGIVFNPPARLDEKEIFAPQIINFSLPPLPGEVLQRILNEKGFAVSTGSACSSNKKSHTQGHAALGISDKTAHSSVRVSMGPTTTKEEIESFITVLKEIKKEFVF